jgi:CheY-like chemotaxis protein
MGRGLDRIQRDCAAGGLGHRPGGAVATILSVDDDPAMRAVLRVGLETAGYGVLDAADADDAWRLLQLVRVDAVVTDVGLPGRDGIELLRSIRADAQLGALPVVVLTGEPAHLRPASDAGASRVLMKPVRLTALREALAEALGGASGA